MQYTLTGFTHDRGFRVFAFQGIGEDRARIEYSVKAEFALILRHGIKVQELPLLCREILERHDGGDGQHVFTYTEADMRRQEEARAARAAEAKLKKVRRTLSENPGSAW
jgi:hypothetical protein